MCFIVRKGEYMQIATKNIPVRKFLMKLPSGELVSAFRQEKYIPGKIHGAKIGQIDPTSDSDVIRGSIEEGLHSYHVNTFNERFFPSIGYTMVDMYIPKGAEYYTDPKCQEYVSNLLVFAPCPKEDPWHIKILKLFKLY